MSDNVVLSKHFDSLASAIQRCLSAGYAPTAYIPAGHDCVIDSVASTVDGGLWYELNDGAPVIKFHLGSQNYSLFPTTADLSPNLALSPSAQTIDATQTATCSVSYLGTGNFSLTAQSEKGTYTPNYDSVNRTISLPYNFIAASGETVTITADLAAAVPYTPASASCTVFMTPELRIALTEDNDEGTTLTRNDGGDYSLKFTASGTDIKIKLLNRNPNAEVTFEAAPYHESMMKCLSFDESTNVLTLINGSYDSWGDNHVLGITNGKAEGYKNLAQIEVKKA